MYILRFGYTQAAGLTEKFKQPVNFPVLFRIMILEGGLRMSKGQGSGQTAFMGLSREQIAKILYEEFSKTGFQFSNFNAMIPPIISRVLMENGSLTGNYITEMLFKGMMGNFSKK